MDLKKKYRELSDFLIGWLDNDASDKDIIKELVEEYYNLAIRQARDTEGDRTTNISRFFKERLERIISEGEEVLAMEPFPNDWICDRSEVCYYDPEDGKTWLRQVLKMLEDEANQTPFPVPFVNHY